MAERVRLLASIRGRVQGVGYRWFALAEARSLGLVGEIRNLRNGTVEVIAEGDRPVLEAFLGRLNDGPVAATVETVNAAWEPAVGNYTNFEIAATR